MLDTGGHGAPGPPLATPLSPFTSMIGLYTYLERISINFDYSWFIYTYNLLLFRVYRVLDLTNLLK